MTDPVWLLDIDCIRAHGRIGPVVVIIFRIELEVSCFFGNDLYLKLSAAYLVDIHLGFAASFGNLITGICLITVEGLCVIQGTLAIVPVEQINILTHRGIVC